MGGLLNRLPAAAPALAAVFGLTVWQPNLLRLPWEDALPTLLGLLAISAVLTLVIRVLTGSWRRASLIAALVLAWCCYAPNAVEKVFASPGWRWAALGLFGLFVLDVARRVPRPSDEAALGRVTRLTNLTLLPYALVMAGIALIIVVRLEQARPAPASVFSVPVVPAAARQGGPDVWHIILDRYARQDTLARVYAHDNAPFIAELRKRGFVVSDQAYSNYQRTGHSVTSTLNSSYLEPLQGRGVRGDDWVPLYRALTDNAALRWFNAAGYRTVFAGSWWNPTRQSPIAQENLHYRSLPELARLVLDQTVPGRAIAALGLPFGDGRADQCAREVWKFRELARLAQTNDRKYVFAHFLLPHPPYVLKADGSCRSLEEARQTSRNENYISQLSFANREVLQLIDAIQAGPRPATIMLHSDEGPWPMPYVGDEHQLGRDPVRVQWDQLPQDKLREKMGILMAVRHADGRPDAPLTSPVNLYPALYNHTWGMNLPLQPDRHSVFNSDDQLLTFTDVAGKLGAATKADGPH